MPPRARKPSPSVELSPLAEPGPTPLLELPSSPEAERIRAALLQWYRRGHRDMPWRRLRDPYAIWVSEIMLQQTRVETVKATSSASWRAFRRSRALAAAPPDEVLALWSGLGYYARARNMHAAAAEIVARYGGEFPRASRSGARAARHRPLYRRRHPVDRLWAAGGAAGRQCDPGAVRGCGRSTQSPDTALGKRLYWSLSAELVPPPGLPGAANDPGDFNQALMELGAMVCVPQRPGCLVCPLAAECAAHRSGEVELYPAKKAVREVPVVQVVTLCLRHRGRVLLLRRPAAGLWGGLWEPATLTREPEEAAGSALLRLGSERLGLDLGGRPVQPLQPFVHVLTHREMHFSPLLLDWPEADESPTPRLLGYEEARFFDLGQPLALGLSAWVTTLLRRIAAEPGPLGSSEPTRHPT